MVFGLAISPGSGQGSGSSGKEPGFFARNRAAIIAGIAAVVVLTLVAVFFRNTATAPRVKQVETITIVPVQPPKPPPPPPPVQQQMIQQPKVTTPIPKPTQPAPPTKVAPPKSAAPAATPLGTSIKGNSPNSFDLTGTPGGDGLLGGGGGGGSGAWAYYASLLQTQINAALQKNPRTNHASFQVNARIWLDNTGRVTRAVVAPSGNAEIDAAIQNEVFTGMRFSEPPPAGMPMPIVISLTGEQPL